MPRLATEQKVRAALGMDPIPDLIQAATTALDRASLRLSSALRTSFDRADRNDTFEISCWETRREFRLSAGFLVANPVIFYAPDLDTLEQGTSVDTTSWVFDLTRGVCSRLRPNDQGYFLFSYTAGFEAANGQYDADQVPDWLEDAACLEATMHLANHPSIKETGVTADLGLLRETQGALLQPYSRYAPNAMLPDLASPF